MEITNLDTIDESPQLDWSGIESRLDEDLTPIGALQPVRAR